MPACARLGDSDWRGGVQVRRIGSVVAVAVSAAILGLSPTAASVRTAYDARAGFSTTAKPTGRELLVEAPLLDLTRPEVIELGQRVHVPWEKTWSCYRENEHPCGRCLPCANRANGFLRAGFPDPLLLEPVAAGK